MQLRHDGTSGTPGSGVALAAGGALDTILGTHTLTIDGLAGTVQLDAGPVLAIPQPGDPDLADFVVVSELGAVVHLDFTAFDGTSSAASLVGDGSVSIDGASFVALDYVDDDLALLDPALGILLHLDTTGIHRAGSELVTFGGAVNAFDVLQGIADDLRNVDGLPPGEMLDRLGVWLEELDRNHENVLVATGTLGARSAGLSSLETRLVDERTQNESLRSAIEDADFSQVVLEMTRAEQTLQLTQATGIRLLQSTLLQFLR
jgi:flagellin-like hook-associated protein FlgL